MPPVSNLSPRPPEAGAADVRVVFASGIADLNRAVTEHFTAHSPELPLLVVSEFSPSSGEWIVWHVRRPFEQNLAYLKIALGKRRIVFAAAVWDHRSGLSDLRKAAQAICPDVLTAYDEDMHAASPKALRGFLARRRLLSVTRQVLPGGRLRSWLRRLAHPSEAEIPLRARAAQARGLAASRTRGIRKKAPMTLKAERLLKGVTVVIPSRDGLELLRESLPAVIAQLDAGEIIVVDNGSSDETADWLAVKHPAIRVIRHTAPLSFAAAVNLGICEAKFSRTLMLNNDMIAEPGFVDALNKAFQRVPDLFCATAQIFFPEGIRREETGKTVWRRTSDLDFPVRCDDPVPGEDLTWVLYGSGGCSLFETTKLAALGGVSEVYSPAYVEDMDFGYCAWKHGWPTVYCAQARVEHRHRSTTSRFYSERQIDFFVERNYLRFVANAVSDPVLFERLWLEGVRRLQLQAMQGRGAALDTLRDIPQIGPTPPAPSGHLSETEILALTNGDVSVFPGRPHSGRETILVASPYLPFPLSHGGAVRMFNLMKLAAQENELVLVAFGDELTPPAPELLALCREIVLVKRHGSHYRRDTKRPDMVEEFDSATFRACLRQAVHQWKPEIAQLEFTWMAQYADACQPAKTILVEHDITFDLQEQLLSTTPPDTAGRLELEQQLAKWRAFENAAWSQVDCVVAMSEKDAKAIEARAVECLPNGVDCDRFQPSGQAPEPRRLLLIGSFAHLPNLLALEFFLQEVWPLLGPGYKLHVIGGARHDYYLNYFRNRVSIDTTLDGVEIEGFVPDVRRAYGRASVVLAPLTASAGTNLKVLEAMAMGKAVVSTPAGVNGLTVEAGAEFLLGETAALMARDIRRMTDDAASRLELEKRARQAALRFDWKAIGVQQQGIYDKLRATGRAKGIQ